MWAEQGNSTYAGAIVRRAIGTVPPSSVDEGVLVADVPSPASSVVDAGVAPSTTYSYTVFAHDATPVFTPGTSVTVTTPSTAAGPLHVCGDITQSTTWSPSAATAYVLDCPTTVAAGSVLTVQPGTIVKARPGVGIEVHGALATTGTAGSPAVFTSLADDAAGGDTNGDGVSTLPAPGDWSGISASTGATVSLDRAAVSYAGTSLSASSASAITVTASTIRHSSSYGVSVSYVPTVTVTDTTVEDSGSVGIVVGMDPNDTVHAPTVARNIVREARDQAVVVTGSRLLPAQLAGNTGSGNRMNTIAVSGRLAGDLTLPQAGLAWTVGPWCCTGGLTVDPGATLRLDAGATLKFDQFAGLTVHGTLIGAGTASSPATLTALTDDSVAGDTNGDGVDSLPRPGDWGGIAAGPVSGTGGPVVSLSRATVSYAGTGVGASSISELTVTNSAIRHSSSYGISVSHVPKVTVTDNSLLRSGSVGIVVGMDPNDTVHAPTVARNIVREARDQAVVVTGSRLLPAQLAGNTGSGNRMNTIAVSGRLAGDLTLPQAGLAWTVGPWCCTGGLTVDPGATLRLDAGATLKFDQFAGLTVHGTLIGAGTASSPATLTALTDDSVAGDTNGDGTATTPTPGHWAGISAGPQSGTGGPVVSLSRATVSYAGTGVSASSISELTVTNSAIRHSSSYGVSVSQVPTVTVTDTTVEDSGSVGIVVGMDPNDTVHAPTVARNIVREARDQAVVVTGSRLLPAQLAGNTGSGNRMNTIAVSGRLAGDLTLPQAGLAWTVGPWCCTGGLTVDPGATLRLDAGATLKFDQFAGLTVHGTLIGAGTASSPATLTALTDDSVAGDTNGDGTATTPTPGHWAGICRRAPVRHGRAGCVPEPGHRLVRGDGRERVIDLRADRHQLGHPPQQQLRGQRLAGPDRHGDRHHGRGQRQRRDRRRDGSQ